MSQTSDAMRTQSDADQEPPVTTPPDPQSVPGGPAAPADGQAEKSRDGGEDIQDDSSRSTAYAQAQQQ